ncbi:hypothetical protein [Streptomyces sp. NPDC051546]|uniref:hypothetical protein n=1 Tax=Streptomyces sp. NPDC051546 TaxID=3365655 RepID=UPI0037A3D0EC
MALWAEAGENLRRIVPLLGPDAPSADEPEDCHLRPGCYRPVYENSSSHTLIGAGPMPVIGLCRVQRVQRAWVESWLRWAPAASLAAVAGLGGVALWQAEQAATGRQEARLS